MSFSDGGWFSSEETFSGIQTLCIFFLIDIAFNCGKILNSTVAKLKNKIKILNKLNSTVAKYTGLRDLLAFVS